MIMSTSWVSGALGTTHHVDFIMEIAHDCRWKW